MKPAWIYDKELKKHVVIPYHLMETFDDGEKGFFVHGGVDQELLGFARRHKNYFYEEDKGFLSRVIFTQNKTRLRIKGNLDIGVGIAVLMMIVSSAGIVLYLMYRALMLVFW